MREIDRGFARLSEGLVHYRERPGSGAATAPPLLMLHASPASSHSLEPLLLALDDKRRLIAPDTLGNGSSVRPAPEQPEMADYADAMDRFCDTLGLEAVDVFGTHTGAHIAVELAVQRPQRVRRLILEGILTLDDEERADYLANYAPPQHPDNTGSQFHWAWHYMRDQMIFFPHYKKDMQHLREGGSFDAHVLHGLTLDILNSLETYHLAYEAVFRHAIGERLREISCPLLWLDVSNSYLDAGRDLALATVAHAQCVKVAHEPQAMALTITEFCDAVS